jgi:chromosome partitioning protein
MMQAILVVNSKGGCGKTTIATNLASAYAAGGLKVALADADKQKSSLGWGQSRQKKQNPIRTLDWTKKVSKIPKGIDRLIIDAPAGLSVDRFKTLLRMADAVLLPILPSAFDKAATKGFIQRIEAVKSIRKNRKPVGVVANRVRPRGRAHNNLMEFLDEIGHPPVAQIRYRAMYPDVAENGLGVFDSANKASRDIQSDWTPLITFIETLD